MDFSPSRHHQSRAEHIWKDLLGSSAQGTVRQRWVGETGWQSQARVQGAYYVSDPLHTTRIKTDGNPFEPSPCPPVTSCQRVHFSCLSIRQSNPNQFSGTALLQPTDVLTVSQHDKERERGAPKCAEAREDQRRIEKKKKKKQMLTWAWERKGGMETRGAPYGVLGFSN